MRIVRPVVDRVRDWFPWPVNRRPIFVLGNQKSGTSAIAGLLGKATGLSAAIDIPGILEPVQQELHSGALPFGQFIKHNRYEFSRRIIKEPSLTLLVKHIDEHFDAPRFVFVVRDPRQNIRSILNRLGLPGDQDEFDEELLSQTVTNWNSWKSVVDGRWLGIPHRDYVGALAARWNLMFDVFDANRHRFVLARYEDFLVDKSKFIQDLACDLDLVPRHSIVDVQDMQFQPRGDRLIAPLDFFGSANLSRIETICSRQMKLLGYE